MAYQQSPGINITEIDLTTIVPGISTSEGAIAGVFRWGPVNERVLIDSETQLVNRFGKPTNFNAETFFTAASFLGYSNQLFVVRAANTTGLSPIVTANIVESTATVDVGNTSLLTDGMILIASDDTAAIRVGTTISVTNATHVTLAASSDALANSTGASLQFVANTTAFNAVVNTASVANLTSMIVKSENDYVNKDGTFDTDVQWIARWPGDIGNSLKISVCDSNTAFTSNVDIGNSTITFTVGSNTASVTEDIASSFSVGDLIKTGNASIGTQYLKITAITDEGSNTTFNFEDDYRLGENFVASDSIQRSWEYFELFDSVPGTSDFVTNFGNTAARDELHVVVVDEDGKFTGVPGTVLERFEALSRATDAKTIDGGTNYYKNVINEQSNYIWWANDRSNSVSNNALNVTSSSQTTPYTASFQYGQDGSNEAGIAVGVLANGYDQFASTEDVEIGLVMQGKARGGTAGGQLANYLIDNICEKRIDCVAFISPDKADVVNNVGFEATDIVAFRNTLRSSSYGFLDSGYKYMYDRYNDVYRWVPMNGDTAGLAARTEITNDAWWSPAGFNRGNIRNIVKLAYNPRKSDRDILYKSGINPVVTFPGEGTILFGDKTLLAKPSAFDRINVRRLFIVLEKAISRASKYTLFEFNDAFTRAQFRNLITPYLRDVQGRRGITDFLVVCDETNNTPEVIDRNEFVGDIYIKPARSINFIQLNFIAVRTGVAFSEVVGQF